MFPHFRGNIIPGLKLEYKTCYKHPEITPFYCKKCNLSIETWKSVLILSLKRTSIIVKLLRKKSITCTQFSIHKPPEQIRISPSCQTTGRRKDSLSSQRAQNRSAPHKIRGRKKNPNCVAVKISIVPTTFPCDSTLLKLSKENYLTFGSGNVSTTYWLLTVSAETVTDPAG